MPRLPILVYYNRARLNKRLLYRHVQVILSYSYTYRCSNCALNHLQNDVDCLCCKEVQKCVESLEALLSLPPPQAFPRPSKRGFWRERRDHVRARSASGGTGSERGARAGGDAIASDWGRGSCCLARSRELDTTTGCETMHPGFSH